MHIEGVSPFHLGTHELVISVPLPLACFILGLFLVNDGHAVKVVLGQVEVLPHLVLHLPPLVVPSWELLYFNLISRQRALVGQLMLSGERDLRLTLLWRHVLNIVTLEHLALRMNSRLVVLPRLHPS